MDPATKDRLLWSLVGLLSFLVLIQAFELATTASVTVGVKAGVALLVGIVAGMLTPRVRERLD